MCSSNRFFAKGEVVSFSTGAAPEVYVLNTERGAQRAMALSTISYGRVI